MGACRNRVWQQWLAQRPCTVGATFIRVHAAGTAVSAPRVSPGLCAIKSSKSEGTSRPT